MAAVAGLGLALCVPAAAVAASDEPGVHALPRMTDAVPEPRQLRLRNAGLIAGASVLVGAYGLGKWWEDGFTGKFRTVNESWFGPNTPYGGQDKLGHAFFSYMGTRLLTRAFEAAGNEPGSAVSLGAWSTLGIMTAVEAADGYSRKYKFSTEDAVMNIAGAVAGYVLESNPALDRRFDFRLLYKPSPETKQAGQYDIAGDYSGQTYLLVAKASGVPALREHPVLRYLELAVGYSAHGYDGAPGTGRSRHAYFGVSLNLSEVLRRTAYRGAVERSAVQRTSEFFLEFVQVPGTAVLADHRF